MSQEFHGVTRAFGKLKGIVFEEDILRLGNKYCWRKWHLISDCIHTAVISSVNMTHLHIFQHK